MIMTDNRSFADEVRDHATDDSSHAHQVPERRSWTGVLEHLWLTLADLSATPKESVVGSFHAHNEYDPLPALRRYGGPTPAVVTPVNDARFGLHNLGADLPHTSFTGIGRWFRMDKPEGFDRILGEYLARVRATGALRSREPGK
jgi:hypothetical protein